MYTIRDIIAALINIVFTVVEVCLILRLLLKLLMADRSAEFVRWIYETSQPLIAPFEGMFPTVVESGIVIEFSTLFAIVIYAVVGYLLIELINVLAVAANSRRRNHHPHA